MSLAQMPLTLHSDPVPESIVGRLYGEPMVQVPKDLYIPPDALEIFLESFEGPLDLLLYLIRKQKFDIMDIPMALVTEQYMQYVEVIREKNLDLAADYLQMAAFLMRIKSQLMLPVIHEDTGETVEDPQAELQRRLLEYEKIKLAAQELRDMPLVGRDFWVAALPAMEVAEEHLPQVTLTDLAQAWATVVKLVQLRGNHHIRHQELSVREYMTRILTSIPSGEKVEFYSLFRPEEGFDVALVIFLALLELAKDGLITMAQETNASPLYVTNHA